MTMECERIRQLLSEEPKGLLMPHDPAVRSHLHECPACRAFWNALVRVDQALVLRPLPVPDSRLAQQVMALVRLSPRRQVPPPFSRAFWLLGMAVTLCALVSGALLLHAFSTVPVQASRSITSLWLNPAWAGDASSWLTLEGEQAAQVVLPIMAGIVVTLAGATIGFRASGHRDQNGATPQRRARPRH